MIHDPEIVRRQLPDGRWAAVWERMYNTVIVIENKDGFSLDNQW